MYHLTLTARGLLVGILALTCTLAEAKTPQRNADPEAQVASRVEALRSQPMQLRAMLREMPKGGDLHNHLVGAVYAEDYLTWAGERGLCIDTNALAVAPPPCTGSKLVPAQGLDSRDSALYNRMVDDLSVRGWLNGVKVASGHDAFFSTFARFGTIAFLEPGRSIAAVRKSAALGGISYLELQNAPPSMGASMDAPGDPLFRRDDFEGAYQRLQPMLEALAKTGPVESAAADAESHALLACSSAQPDPACQVVTRYLCSALRTFTPAQVFRQLAQCFTLAARDPRYVGINLVAPEDDPVAVRDYDLHMRMIAFLSDKHPNVNITLHAGELFKGLASIEAMRRPIADAIAIGRARRIGHGIDIAFEEESSQTLARMAKERIAIEINLVSNDVILGVRGGDHPLALYREAGVPIVLSTDDEGVLRTDIVEQYVRAVTEQNMSYGELKLVARNSLHYAFIEGASLWTDLPGGARISECANLGSPSCGVFAAGSAKAALQIKLEQDLVAYEQRVLTAPGIQLPRYVE